MEILLNIQVKKDNLLEIQNNEFLGISGHIFPIMFYSDYNLEDLELNKEIPEININVIKNRYGEGGEMTLEMLILKTKEKTDTNKIKILDYKRDYVLCPVCREGYYNKKDKCPICNFNN